jgi:hypothetical protein
MAALATLEAAEARAREKVADGTWINAHSERDFNGVIKIRFQRYMSPLAPDAGEWVETAEDDVV